MPRSIWNGTIRVAQLSVPIKLFPAVSSRRVRFRRVHRPDLAPVEYRLFCAAEDREIPRDEVVKGYEITPGRHAVVSEERLKEAAGPVDKQIHIERFVALDDLEPLVQERSYRVGPQERAGQAYGLLRDALLRTGRAGVGRFVFHNRERLVALRASHGILILHTLHGAEDVIAPSEVRLPDGGEPADQETEMAKRLVQAMVEPFDISRWRDEYRERVLALVEAKARGSRPERQAPEEPAPAGDLMSALRESLERIGRQGSRRQQGQVRR